MTPTTTTIKKPKKKDLPYEEVDAMEVCTADRLWFMHQPTGYDFVTKLERIVDTVYICVDGKATGRKYDIHDQVRIHRRNKR